MEYVLITGGMGYIGSHIANKLLEDGKNIIIVDTKTNPSLFELWRKYIKNERIVITRYDLSFHSDISIMVGRFSWYKIIGVIHCAAMKSVPESIQDPLLYYENNINSIINLLKVMSKLNIKNLIFSSSATVYSGNSSKNIFDENDISFPTTPYGNTKLIGEKILEDIFKSDNNWRIISLRYFNPAVCHLDVTQGDTGLFTSVEKVLKHESPFLSIYGNDYDTPDGSCIRDYIHIDDLVNAHIFALDFIKGQEHGMCEAINVGTGAGFSTLEVAKEFKKLNENFEYKIMPRRDGDAAVSVANCSKAKRLLGWTAKFSLHDICKDILRRIV